MNGRCKMQQPVAEFGDQIEVCEGKWALAIEKKSNGEMRAEHQLI